MKMMKKVTSLWLTLLLLVAMMPVVMATADPDPVCEPVDVVLVLDRSGSIAGAPLAAAKSAAKTFVELLNLSNGSDTDQGATVSFASGATLDQGLTTDESALDAAIDGVVAGGLTCISCGIDTAQMELDDNGRSDANHVIILLTDGVPTADTDATALAAADDAKAAGTVIFTIGLGFGVDDDLLEDIASMPDFYSAGGTDDLEEIYEEIADDVCRLPPPKDDEVPEFSTVVAAGMIAIAGLYIYRRRKD